MVREVHAYDPHLELSPSAARVYKIPSYHTRSKIKTTPQSPVSQEPTHPPANVYNGDQMLQLIKQFAADQSGFELEDLKGCYVEFSKDQHGSRFLQKELEVVDSDMIQLVFEEVMPAVCSLMIDVYGNYVVQKFFDFGTDEQRILLTRKLRGNVVPLSLHLYGCRVVQKALETLPGYLQVRVWFIVRL